MDNSFFDSMNLNESKGYWFIRTDSGLYFDTYTENGFIGIGWNEITKECLENSTPSGIEIKERIARFNGYDLKIKRGKFKATAAYNKLIRFKNLKRGDVVVIPSSSSSRLAFGVIKDNSIYVDIENCKNCEYQKRRKVQWLETKPLSKLDPKFYQIILTQHAISDIKKYENNIDNVTNTLYYKYGYGHVVLDIKTNNDVNVKSLINLVESVQELIEKINSYYNFNEDINNSSIKLNLQSPGSIEFKLLQGKSLALFTSILLVLSCGTNEITNPNPEISNENLTNFIEINNDTIQRIEQVMNELQIDREKINKIQQ